MGEPMINYRRHDLSFTTFFMNDGIKDNIADEINVRWRIMEKAELAGYKPVVCRCTDLIVNDYVGRIQNKMESGHRRGLSMEEFDQSLVSHVRNQKEDKNFRARVYFGLAESLYWNREFAKALPYYKMSIEENPNLLNVRIKYIFLVMGAAGIASRNTFSYILRNFKRLIFTK
jgi:hypothetical protein